jgi:hypothetical protein
MCTTRFSKQPAGGRAQCGRTGEGDGSPASTRIIGTLPASVSGGDKQRVLGPQAQHFAQLGDSGGGRIGARERP